MTRPVVSRRTRGGYVEVYEARDAGPARAPAGRSPARADPVRGPGRTATTMDCEMGTTHWLEKAEIEVRQLG